jgi:hypothetical protein
MKNLIKNNKKKIRNFIMTNLLKKIIRKIKIIFIFSWPEEKRNIVKKILYKWNKFIVYENFKNILFYILFIIFYIIFCNIIYILILNYTLYLIKFFILNFLPVYLLLNLLINNKFLFSILNIIFIIIINSIKIYSIIDYIDITDNELNLEINLFSIDELYHWYNIFKRKFSYMIFKNPIKDSIENNINNNIKNLFKNKNYIKLNENNISFFQGFLNIFSNLKFYFINLSIKDFNNNINLLFNNSNIYFKNIFSINNYVNDVELINNNLNKIISNMEKINDNYNYLLFNKSAYINYREKELFFFNLLKNLNNQRLELENLNLKIERLFLINEELEFDWQTEKKIYNIQRLYISINAKVNAFESSEFYKFYKIELEINKVSFKINEINDKILSDPFILENILNDKYLISKLFNLYLYNFFLLNEKLYYIMHFELGFSELDKINIKLFLKENIDLLYVKLLDYDNKLHGCYLKNYRNKNNLILNYLQLNNYYNKIFKGKSFFCTYLEKNIKEEIDILKNIERRTKIRLLKPWYYEIVNTPEEDMQLAISYAAFLERQEQNKKENALIWETYYYWAAIWELEYKENQIVEIKKKDKDYQLLQLQLYLLKQIKFKELLIDDFILNRIDFLKKKVWLEKLEKDLNDLLEQQFNLEKFKDNLLKEELKLNKKSIIKL